MGRSFSKSDGGDSSILLQLGQSNVPAVSFAAAALEGTVYVMSGCFRERKCFSPSLDVHGCGAKFDERDHPDQMRRRQARDGASMPENRDTRHMAARLART